MKSIMKESELQGISNSETDVRIISHVRMERAWWIMKHMTFYGFKIS